MVKKINSINNLKSISLEDETEKIQFTENLITLDTKKSLFQKIINFICCLQI
jgi:hypothetical protein